MSTPGIYVEISELIAYVEQNFKRLKLLVQQPLCYESTGDADADAQKERDLKSAPNEYADAIAASIQDVAEFYGMNPKRLKTSSMKTPDGQIAVDLQRRVIELHKEFYEFIDEHGIYTYRMRVNKHGISLRPPPRKRETKLNIRFDNMDWDEY